MKLLPLLIVLLVTPAAQAAAPSPTPAATLPVIAVERLPDPYPWPPNIGNRDPIALEFSVDLDLLAPLGSKPGNGATWFAHFTKIIGDRLHEVESAQQAAVPWLQYGTERPVLPPDHPLLLEAEPWIDHAVWSFYPEVWPWQGGPTPIPNLLFALQLGRSWVARGQSAADPERAAVDFRRTIRLGRLLLQDDVVFIQNFIGIALIRTGAEAFFESARRRGDGATAALAALVIHDCTALRLELSRRFQRISLFPDFVARIELAYGATRTELRLPDERFEHIVRTAVDDPCRALRMEATVPLWITSHLGTDTQRARARTTLEALRKDPDELVAAAAEEVRNREFVADDLEAHWIERVPLPDEP